MPLVALLTNTKPARLKSVVADVKVIRAKLRTSLIVVSVMPGTDGIQIHLKSVVERYYGDSIRATIRSVLEEMGGENVNVEAVDHGALDCTIRARVTTAVRRASGEV